MDNNITKLRNLTKSGRRPRTSPGLVFLVLEGIFASVLLLLFFAQIPVLFALKGLCSGSAINAL